VGTGHPLPPLGRRCGAEPTTPAGLDSFGGRLRGRRDGVPAQSWPHADGGACVLVRACDRTPMGMDPGRARWNFTMPGSQGPTVTITTPTSATTYSTGAATIAISGRQPMMSAGHGRVVGYGQRGVRKRRRGRPRGASRRFRCRLARTSVTVTARDGQNNTATDVLTVHTSPTRRHRPSISRSRRRLATYSTTSPTLGLGGVARATTLA
jgi:hypothetical protein